MNTQLLIAALSAAPQLFEDGLETWKTLASTEGGAEKIQNAIGNLTTLLAHSAQAVTAIKKA